VNPDPMPLVGSGSCSSSEPKVRFTDPAAVLRIQRNSPSHCLRLPLTVSGVGWRRLMTVSGVGWRRLMTVSGVGRRLFRLWFRLWTHR
jgi:hypothetical protein